MSALRCARHQAFAVTARDAPDRHGESGRILGAAVDRASIDDLRPRRRRTARLVFASRKSGSRHKAQAALEQGHGQLTIPVFVATTDASDFPIVVRRIGRGVQSHDAAVRDLPSKKQELKELLRKLGIAVTVLGLAVAALALDTPTQAQGLKVGVLTCNVASGFGFIFGSSRAINCTFSPTRGPPQHYTGTINKFGVDIGYLQGGVIVWAVFAPTANTAPGSLSGTYAGATAGATVAVGLGANVLVGGSGNSIALQPVSIEGTTGLNVAAGIAEMTLSYQPG